MAYAAAVVLVGTANVNPLNLSSGITFDGIAPTAGQRILLTGQTTTSQNGVWIFNGTGAAHPMTRPTVNNDQYATTNTLDNNTLIPVTGGNTYGGTCWGLDPSQVVKVDTTGHTLTRVALPPVQARAASTANLSSLTNVTSIDNVTLVGNGAQGSDIVLLKNQTTASANGLYWAFPGSGNAMVRCTEPLPPARQVHVSEGAVNPHTHWALVTQGAMTLGTTSLTFSKSLVRPNVRDFGAVGNGVTDDSAAIAAATAAATPAVGAAVLFPPGTYLIGSGTSVTFPSNVQLTFEEGASIATSVASQTINGRITAHPTQQIFGIALLGNVTATGTAPPTVTVSGFANAIYSFKVVITTTGALGTAVFEYSLNGGTNYVTGVTTPTNGIYVVPGTGCTINFASGTYTAGGSPDTYTWASTAAAQMSLTAAAAPSISVKWFGAQGNGNTVTNAAITHTTAILTSPTTFLATDVGKSIVVAGAGPSTTNYNLVTTILSVSSGTATLSANATATVSSASAQYGNDDSTSINNASQSISSGALLFTPGSFFIGAATAVTIPSALQVEFHQGAVLTPSTPNQVTIKGPIGARPTQQIFGGFGGLSSVTSTGTGTGVVTVTGCPTGSWQFEIQIITGGTLSGSSNVSFQYSLNSTSTTPTWSNTITTSTSPYPYAIPGTGVTVTLGAGTYIGTGAGQSTFSWTSSPPVALVVSILGSSSFPLKWWGAAGDGATDDGPAISNATQSLPGNRSPTLAIPPGTYVVQESFSTAGRGLFFEGGILAPASATMTIMARCALTRPSKSSRPRERARSLSARQR